MGPIGCPETSVNNYQPTLQNISEERKYRGGSLKSRMVLICNLLFLTSEQILLVRTVVVGLPKAVFLYHPQAAKPVRCLAKHLDVMSDCQLLTFDDVNGSEMNRKCDSVDAALPSNLSN